MGSNPVEMSSSPNLNLPHDGFVNLTQVQYAMDPDYAADAGEDARGSLEDFGYPPLPPLGFTDLDNDDNLDQDSFPDALINSNQHHTAQSTPSTNTVPSPEIGSHQASTQGTMLLASSMSPATPGRQILSPRLTFQNQVTGLINREITANPDLRMLIDEGRVRRTSGHMFAEMGEDDDVHTGIAGHGYAAANTPRFGATGSPSQASRSVPFSAAQRSNFNSPVPKGSRNLTPQQEHQHNYHVTYQELAQFNPHVNPQPNHPGGYFPDQAANHAMVPHGLPVGAGYPNNDFQAGQPFYGGQQYPALGEQAGTHLVYNVQFRSCQEAVDHRFGYDNSVFPGGVMQIQNPSVPPPGQHVDLVRQLIDAMYDITEAQDNDAVVKPWAPGGDRYKEEAMLLVEVACWKLLRNCIEHCEEGPRMAKWGPLGKAAQPTKVPVFGDHFKNVLQALKERKSICKRIVSPDYMDQVVDDPRGAVKRVAANKSLNKTKAGVMEAGKQALRAKRSLTEPEDENDDEHDDSAGQDDDEDYGPTPRAKKTKTRKVSSAGKANQSPKKAKSQTGGRRSGNGDEAKEETASTLPLRHAGGASVGNAIMRPLTDEQKAESLGVSGQHGGIPLNYTGGQNPVDPSLHDYLGGGSGMLVNPTPRYRHIVPAPPRHNEMASGAHHQQPDGSHAMPANMNVRWGNAGNFQHRDFFGQNDYDH